MGKLKFLGERAVDLFWTLAVLIFLAALCCPANGAPPLIVTDSGHYLLEVGPGGEPVIVPYTPIIDLRGGGDGDPDDPDAPDIDVELVRKVQGWAEETGDTLGAQAIAAVYSHVRGALADDTLSADNVWDALRLATDSALAATGTKAKWVSFRESLDAVVTEGLQRGTLSTSAQIQQMLRSVQHGLELSADGSPALDIDTLTTIAIRTNGAIDANK